MTRNSNWGGAREGAGRTKIAPPGAKRRTITVTNLEYQRVCELLEELRDTGEEYLINADAKTLADLEGKVVQGYIPKCKDMEAVDGGDDFDEELGRVVFLSEADAERWVRSDEGKAAMQQTHLRDHEYFILDSTEFKVEDGMAYQYGDCWDATEPRKL